MKGNHLFPKIIILFTCLFIFSAPSLALIPGDFGSADNGPPDGCVDFEDLMIFALAYGSTEGDANWNPLCDIYPDGVIDFEDLMVFAMHYGEFLVHNLTKDTYYDTIQAALDDADTDNTIEVADGTYNESITFPSGKVIILQSVNGTSSTTIRGNDGSDTVTFDGSLTGTILEGFTITHDTGMIGNGVHIVNSDIHIRNCNISDNYSNTYCVGIYNEGNLTITESNISDNSSNSTDEDDVCFGISNSGILNINQCTIFSNFSNNSFFAIFSDGTLNITGSSISNNSANDVCIGIFINSGDLTITGSNIYGNSGAWGGGIYFDFPTSGTLPIGGNDESEKNTICGNGPSDGSFSLDFQIGDAFGSLYDTYKDTNHISAYCE